MNTSISRWRGSRRGVAAGTLAAALLLGACDLTVTNPGPVQDSFLDDPGAYPAVLQGVKRAYGMGLTRIALDGAMMAREGIPGGLFGTDFVLGTMTSSNVNDHWERLQQARWLAEDGVRRMTERQQNSGAIFAEMLLQAGYANRSLGHHMCTAVFDGGAPGDFMQYFDRAEDHFDAALAAAQAANSTALANAARAGRADVRMWNEDWTGAVQDAEAITDQAFNYQISFDALDFQSGANEMYFRQASLPWREYTVWNTFVEDYYTTTGDPRTAWRTNPADPITMVDNLPFYVQLKFTTPTGPHTLSSYWEMLLVRAEAILVNTPGNFADAVALINQVHTRNISDNDDNPLPALVAADATEAWELLKQERRIELWGEARRFGDLRRWHDQSRPGDQPMEDMSGRSSCFPVGIGEIRTNTNSITTITAANSPRFP
jgi:hypothetical protein